MGIGQTYGSITDLPAEAIAAAGRTLRIAPESVATAREFTARFLTDNAKLDDDHVDDVVLVVSELTTNSVKYGGNGRRNIYLDVEVWSKWTLVKVDDRSSAANETEPAAAGDGLRESGRGLLVVRTIAERFWWHPRLISKTANAGILRPGIMLTDADNTILDDLENDR